MARLKPCPFKTVDSQCSKEKMPDFLLEIGCEEIPARMARAAQEELAKRVRDLCNRERLAHATADDNHGSGADPALLRALSTPRRLTVFMTGILLRQPYVGDQMQAWATK